MINRGWSQDEVMAFNETITETVLFHNAGSSRKVTISVMMFFRFENGKMVELSESDDHLGFRQQLECIK